MALVQGVPGILTVTCNDKCFLTLKQHIVDLNLSRNVLVAEVFTHKCFTKFASERVVCLVLTLTRKVDCFPYVLRPLLHYITYDVILNPSCLYDNEFPTRMDT